MVLKVFPPDVKRRTVNTTATTVTQVIFVDRAFVAAGFGSEKTNSFNKHPWAGRSCVRRTEEPLPAQTDPETVDATLSDRELFVEVCMGHPGENLDLLGDQWNEAPWPTKVVLQLLQNRDVAA